MANYRLRIGALTGYPLTAEGGSYALSGQTAGLTYTPAPVNSPYTWYPTLDKTSLPFTLTEAAAPTGTMTDVTVTSSAELAAQIYTPNRRITITSSFTGGTYNGGDITDVDIIIQPGVTISGPVLFGGSTRTITRLRIRGTTVGTYSGGTIASATIAGPATDVIFDGVRITGSYLVSALRFNVFSSPYVNRAAVTNCRIYADGIGIASTAGHISITGNSIITGMDTAAQFSPTNEEAYGVRCYFQTAGNILLYANDIRSNPDRSVSSHARFRCHPDPGLDNVYVKQNRFIERVENWLVWVDAESGGGAGDANVTYIDDNEFICDSTGTGSSATPRLTGDDTLVAYIRNNTFQTTDFVNDTSIFLTGVNSTTKSGNTYSTPAPVSDPAWGAALASGLVPGTGNPATA